MNQDLNYHLDLNYYLSIISLDKCNGICNAVDDYLQKYVVLVKYKVFNMITKINARKAFLKHISCDCKSKFDSTRCNLNQKWNNDKYQYECKKYRTREKDLVSF